MKKKLLSIILAVSFACTVIGCGATMPEDTNTEPYVESLSVQAEESPAETLVDESVVETESEEETTEVTNTGDAGVSVDEAVETPDLTLADLAERRFEFYSGLGTWSESFTIEEDGFFGGNFYDYNMGEIGERYEEGTCYINSYTGHFTNLTKIDEYTYTMELQDITYKKPVGEEIIAETQNIRYVYTESLAFSETDTFTIYLPGTPLDIIAKEIWLWIPPINESEKELTMTVIADEEKRFGIYSYDRPKPLEDAQLTYNNYKYSYDHYNELLTEAATTAEMVEYSAIMYEFSDECLNYIWRLIRYNTEEESYNEILAEQREWITEKEAKATEASAEYEGGSLAAVAYNQTLADMTIRRCEELIGYLE